MALTIETSTRSEGELLVTAVGEVDVSCASELRDAIDAALAAEGVASVAVDLAQVPYIDSTGIGVLVGAAHHASETGLGFAVEGPQRNVRRVLDMLGIAAELGLADAQA